MHPNKTDAAAARVARELQRGCLRLYHQSWSSLVVIPTDPTTPTDGVTAAFAEAAKAYDLSDIEVIDTANASGAAVTQIIETVSSRRATLNRCVIAVHYPIDDPRACALIKAADAAVLVLRLGVSNLDVAQSVVEVVGAERVLGALLI